MTASVDALYGDPFGVEVRDDGEETRIVLHGELDLGKVGEAACALRRAEGDGQPVVVDLSDLRFMDLAGLGLMLAAHERLGPRLSVRGGSGAVRLLFELTGTAERLPFID